MKMNLEADLHVHTVASDHAYSTVTEVASAAALKGLKIINIKADKVINYLSRLKKRLQGITAVN